MHDFTEVMKVLHRGKAVSLEDDLTLEIMNIIERMTVAVCSSLEIGYSLSLWFVHRFPFVLFHTFSDIVRPISARRTGKLPTAANKRDEKLTLG
jgi:hypothetical protein